jgi:S-DNA-T family DNA segregation ATPase FtsK/SpoIIIE
MSNLDLQQIMNSRFRTSGEAEAVTRALMQNFGITTKAGVARLAIGRSLSIGGFVSDNIDNKGMDIPASSLFTPDDIAAWVGLIVTHAQSHDEGTIEGMDLFRAAVRKHWHRGVHLLQQDWNDADGSYDKFLETLMTRRADLPDVGVSSGSVVLPPGAAPDQPQDVSAGLIKALVAIGVSAEIKGLKHGPRISRYHLYLPDINQYDKLRRGLERLGIALNLQKTKPELTPGDGANTVNLYLPRAAVTWTPTSYALFCDWVSAAPPKGYQLPVYPGVDAMGAPYSFDLAAAPHLLVGGTTGSGKSVCLHALILSLISCRSPSTLKIALIDPKQVEFAVYRDSPYLYRGEVATTSSAAKDMLDELVTEMQARYEVFDKAGVSNIQEANKKNLEIQYIVVFIEELADLIMLNAGHEDRIISLAQKARAAGIHLVLATQRPEAKTFSGLIRSNIPARIALTVQKSSESNIILDQSGAEDLLGSGDMLVKARPGEPPERVHGVWIVRSDIEKHLKIR